MRKYVSLNFKKIVFTIGLFLLSPMVIQAEPIAHSDSYNGNVFLGGKYIELGINKDGAIGSGSASATIKSSYHFEKSSSFLGMRFNRYGWDSGNEPTTGDFILSDMIDSFVLSYKIGGTFYSHGARSDGDVFTWDKGANPPLTVLNTSTGTKLEATVTGTTAENVELNMTYSFDENDKFFITDVKVTNNSSSELTDVRFTKLTRTTQDNAMQGSSAVKAKTYNKLISNPDLTKAGGEKNMAMVTNLGPISTDFFFYASFDPNATASLITIYDEDDDNYIDPFEDIDDKEEFINYLSENKTTSKYATNENMSFRYPGVDNGGDNGYTLNENGMALSTNLGTLGANNFATTRFYTSLNQDPIDSMNNILSSRLNSVKTRTDSKIEMNAELGYEYSIDGENWNDTGVFTGLTPATEYTISSRMKSSGLDLTELVVTTKASPKDAVALTAVVITENSISIKGTPGYEYSRDNGDHWQTSENFTGLNPDTEYTFIGRLEDSYTDMPGKISDPLTVRTLKKESTVLDALEHVDIDVKIVDAVPTITFSKAQLYELVKDDETVVAALTNGDDVRIVFDCVKIIKDEDDESHFDGKTFAYAFDVEIKLYINGTYEKDINLMSDKLKMVLLIPNEFQKEGRKFYIVRKHNSADTSEWVTIADADADDTTVTLLNDKFSEFFIVYEDPSNSSETTNPKTGDNILTYVTLLIIGVSGLFLTKSKKLDF